MQNFIVPFLFDFVFDADTIPCADGFNDRWSDRVHIVAVSRLESTKFFVQDSDASWGRHADQVQFYADKFHGRAISLQYI